MQVIRAQQGRALQVLGDEVTVKLPSAESTHGLSVVAVTVPPGSGTPCVAHPPEEVYYLLEGELLMHTPDEKHLLAPGDMVHLPPLAPHGYRNPGERPARFLAWTVGGPMDDFFTDMAEQVHQLPQDLPAMGAVLAAHGVQRVA